MSVYATLKELGICVYCAKRMAEPGNAGCFECSESHRNYKMRKRNSMSNEEHEIYKEKKREESLQRYHKRKNEGICVGCGKRNSMNDSVYCIECYVKRKNQYRKRNPYLRTERHEFGLCYICGMPVYENHRTCRMHYESRRRQILINRNHKKLFCSEDSHDSNRNRE